MANQNLYKVFFHKNDLYIGNIAYSKLTNRKNILNHTILLTDNCYYCSFYKVYYICIDFFDFYLHGYLLV